MRFLPRTIVIFILCALSTDLYCPAETAEDKLPLEERVWIACQIYSLTNAYFAHFRGVRELDLDKEFQFYLNRLIATDDRHSFDLASLEFLAKLRNGHTGFRDQWLTDHYGQMLGFYAYPIAGSWVVANSTIPELKVGDVIARIDGQNFEAFFKGRQRYVSASNDRSAHRFFFEYPFLFPASFSVELADNRKVSITRRSQPQPEHYEVTVTQNGDELYIKIPSFAQPEIEESAVQAVETGKSSRAIIIDLRGNHGGSTPSTLLGKLMNQPFRWWSESTPINIGWFKYEGVLGEHSDVFSYGGYAEPDKQAYQGKVYILVDGGCFSACEDFLIPFRDNHRATIVGERTSGSTGQPFTKEFGNGMLVSLSMRRVFMPDGSDFEGVGIIPDVEVLSTAADLRSISDPGLAKVRTLIQGSGPPR